MVGVTRMVLDFVYPEPLCFEEDNRPSVVKDVHYLYFSTMLSFLTLLVVLVVSLATEKPKPEQVNHHCEASLPIVVSNLMMPNLSHFPKHDQTSHMKASSKFYVQMVPYAERILNGTNQITNFIQFSG